jgi:hypothetical protein
MAHLTLQLGAAIIVPVGALRRSRRAGDWRKRAVREAAMLHPQPAAWPAAHLLGARGRGLKIGRALSAMMERV